MTSNANALDDRKSRLPHFRFGLRTVFLLFAFVAVALFALLHFIPPIIAGRWASSHRVVNPRGSYALQLIDDKAAAAAAQQLKHLPYVESLILGFAVTNKGLAALSGIKSHPSLTSVTLIKAPITNAGLNYLSALNPLRNLMFNTCPIANADLARLKSASNLQTLWLVEEGKQARPSRFTERSFAGIGQLKGLHTLNLAGLHISDKAARRLHGLNGLASLQFIRCQISDEAVANLRAALPECEIGRRE